MLELNQTWVDTLKQPFAENPTGDDPRYNDTFYLLKEEINKVGDINFVAVQQYCETLLAEYAKDLRVLSYLCFARTQQSGLLGFVEALRLLLDCFSQFSQAIHPVKITARVSTLRWLDNNRLQSYLQQQIDSADKQQVEMGLALINELNTLASSLSTDYPLFLMDVKKLLEKQRAIFAMIPDPEPEIEVPAAPVSVVTDQSTEPTPETSLISSSGNTAINAEDDLERSVSRQIKYLHDKDQLIRAAAFIRAMRWSELHAPQQQNFITRVPGLREQSIMRLEKTVNGNDPKSVFLLCERLFLEGSFHLYLDLQYYAIQAATNMGKDDLSRHLEFSLRMLLRRAPTLPKLHFADDRPFASVACQAWIDQLTEGNKRPTEARASSDNSMSVDDMINNLRAQTSGKDLASKIRFINEQPVREKRQHFQQQLALGRFCIEEKRLDIAIPILERLVSLVTHYQLADWEPKLAMATWEELRKSLKEKARGIDKPSQDALTARIDGLFGLMCQTDVEMAMSAT